MPVTGRKRARVSLPSLNARTNGAQRLRDVKIIKVPNRRRGGVGYTIVATPRARIGDSGVIDGVRYTIRSEQQLRELIRQGKWDEVERTCTSRITNMQYLFLPQTPFAQDFNRNIGHWDTSKVTDMSDMFRFQRTFNQPIGGWDTSKVTTMESMFHQASSFNQPIGGWDTRRVTDMRSMFSGAHAFNQPIGGWDTRRVTNMRSMFYGALVFNQPIGGWNVGKVTTMQDMFYGALVFNQPIGGWNVGKVTDMGGMFSDARAFDQPIGRWNTGRVTDMSYMFSDASSFNQPIGRWDTSRVTYMWGMFRDARAFDQDLSTWVPQIRGRDVHMDADTRNTIFGDVVKIFKSKKYRLHPEANGMDLVTWNKIPFNNARVLAGDLQGGLLRHVFHKNSLNAMIRSGHSLRHPFTRRPFEKNHIVPLKDVLHANDVSIYNRLNNGKTVKSDTLKSRKFVKD